jgi:KDO2-lipid IV(A) lauroyltransferase
VTWRLEAVAYDVLVSLLGLMPIDTISGFGGGLLRLIGPVAPAHRTARKNLMIAFPDRGKDWIDRTLGDVWENVGRTFFETPFLDKIMADPNRVEIVGGEHLAALAKSGKGAVLISGHISNWEVMPAVIMKYGVDCLISYRPINNPYFDRRVKEARYRYGVRLFAAKSAAAVKNMVQVLRRGGSVAILSDQRHDEGVPVPFFGLNANTNPIAARLALHAGVDIQPMSVERMAGARYRVVVPPPMHPVNTGDRDKDIEAALRQINGFLEESIRVQPAQYFWVHRRWPKPTYLEAA